MRQPAGRGPDRRSGEAEFADGRVDHSPAAELLEEVLGMPVRAAAVAGSFAEIDDVRIAAHLLGDAVAHRVHPTLHDRFAAVGGWIEVLQRWIDRVGPSVQRGGGRIGGGRLPGELGRVAEHLVHLVLDRLQVGFHGVARVEQEAAIAGDRVALEPLVPLLLRAGPADYGIALLMSDLAIGQGFDQGGPLAGSRRSTACLAAFQTASTSLPSTRTPGNP